MIFKGILLLLLFFLIVSVEDISRSIDDLNRTIINERSKLND